jgi:hypothetical protein
MCNSPGLSREGEWVGRGYTAVDFRDAFARYLEPSEPGL